MKKIVITFSLLFVLMIGLTACKENKEEKYLLQVNNIIQAIEELPDEITLDDDMKVTQIQYSYSALPEVYQSKVTNYQKLKEAMNTIEVLKQTQEYQNLAKSVIRSIEYLPLVEEITLFDKALVVEVRNKYDELPQGAKNYVTNYNKLVDLESKIQALEDEEKKIQEVITCIDNLPAFSELTIDDKPLLEDARNKYNLLTTSQKQAITNLDKLEILESQMLVLEEIASNMQKAVEIIEMIDSIPNIEDLTIADKQLLEKIRYEYGRLADEVKSYVTNLDKLVAAEEKMEIIKHIESLKGDAQHVDELIAILPDVEDVTLDDKAQVSNARNWYNRLDEEAKPYVTLLEKLISLETKIEELETIATYKEQASIVSNLIDALPNVDEITFSDQDSIINVRNKYNALKEDVKVYVTNLDKLVMAEEKLADLIANKEYEVLFYLDGGTLDGVVAINEQLSKGMYKGMVVLGTPKKTGYIFGGFYTNENCYGDVITTVAGPVTLYVEWILDNSQIATNQILDCVSDIATSNTKDFLVLENNDATFEWSSSDPKLYTIENGIGRISKVYQTHRQQTITISVKIHHKNGTTEEKSKNITVDPVLFAELPSTPVATYFSTGAMYAYKQYNDRYKKEGTIFSETTKQTLDIIYYSFIEPKADGTCIISDPSYLEEVKDLKNNDVRIIACVNGVSSTTCQAFMTITESPTLRQKFVNNLMNLVEEYNFDGVDIDWETVSSNIKVDAIGMNNLMKDLRAEMTNRQSANGSPYFLSAAVPASSWGTTSDRFDFVTLNQYVDYINIMSYDMNKTDVTTHLSPLYQSKYDKGYNFGCDYGVQRLTSLGLSREKIIIGSAGYGKAYKVTGQLIDNAYPHLGISGNLIQISGIPGSFASGTLYGNAIEALIQTGRYQKFTEYDGNKLVGSYLYSSVDGIFVTYDSAEAIIAKYQYAESMEGVGIMCWCYSEDTSDTIINAIYTAMNM